MRNTWVRFAHTAWGPRHAYHLELRHPSSHIQRDFEEEESCASPGLSSAPCPARPERNRNARHVDVTDFPDPAL